MMAAPVEVHAEVAVQAEHPPEARRVAAGELARRPGAAGSTSPRRTRRASRAALMPAAAASSSRGESGSRVGAHA